MAQCEPGMAFLDEPGGASDAAAVGWSFVPSKFILSGVLRASWDDRVSLHPELQVSLAAG